MRASSLSNDYFLSGERRSTLVPFGAITDMIWSSVFIELLLVRGYNSNRIATIETNGFYVLDRIWEQAQFTVVWGLAP